MSCRSKRKGYLHYAMGQLRQMGKQFYDTDIHVEVLSEQMVGDYSHVTMRYKYTDTQLLRICIYVLFGFYCFYPIPHLPSTYCYILNTGPLLLVFILW